MHSKCCHRAEKGTPASQMENVLALHSITPNPGKLLRMEKKKSVHRRQGRGMHNAALHRTLEQVMQVSTYWLRWVRAVGVSAAPRLPGTVRIANVLLWTGWESGVAAHCTLLLESENNCLPDGLKEKKKRF